MCDRQADRQTYLGVKDNGCGIACLFTVNGNFVAELNPRNSQDRPCKHWRQWELIILHRGVTSAGRRQQPQSHYAQTCTHACDPISTTVTNIILAVNPTNCQHQSSSTIHTYTRPHLTHKILSSSSHHIYLISRYRTFHQGSFVPLLQIFLLFLKRNLFAILVPSVYVTGCL